MIDDRQVAIAESEPPTRAPSYWQGSENYVADKVVAELPELIGEAKDDIIVQTTIDLNLQRAAKRRSRIRSSRTAKR